MGELYGVTPKGFILRRFDTIYADLAERIKRYAGIDITANENSVLNLAICYPVCDIAAQLHEENLEIYNSLHPSTAEGTALDDCCQFGNILRRSARKTVYQISCNVTDGNTIRKDTIIAADTNPRHDLYCDEDTVVSREAFNEAYIRLVVTQSGQSYTIAIDDQEYAYTSQDGNQETILNGLKAALGSSYDVGVENGLLAIKGKQPDEIHKLVLSDNLTTDSITGLVQFSTEEYGPIVMPMGTITNIISNLSTGFNWCENRINPDVGRLEEEDWEYRQSYMERIYSYSSNMADSIRSYLLNNVEGIETVQVYENDEDTEDGEGRAPHSVEIVVSGGDDEEIAYGILRSKAGGIGTNGSVEVDCVGLNGEIIKIRFNRPMGIYAWIMVELHGQKSGIPSNYEKIVKDIILNAYSGLQAGDPLILQRVIGEIYLQVSGVEYAYIYQYHSKVAGATPDNEDYEQTNISVASREMVILSADRIEVSVIESN